MVYLTNGQWFPFYSAMTRPAPKFVPPSEEHAKQILGPYKIAALSEVGDTCSRVLILHTVKHQISSLQFRVQKLPTGVVLYSGARL